MLRQSGCIATTLLVLLLARQAPPTIRSRTTLVPIDVRVVDLSGNPITDLKRDDFVIEEDGIRQDIKLFETRTLTAAPPSAETAASALLPLRRDLTPGAPSGAANQRVFLIAFGRGRLQAPAKAVDAVIRFVRERLLPQDRVAVLAWNRSTDFTTDRAATLATLEQFKKDHEQVEADLVQYFSSLRARYSNGEIPPEIQVAIDAIFRRPGGAAARPVPSAPVTIGMK